MKASSSMLVTLEGIVTLTKPLQLEKARFPISVTAEGTVYDPVLPFGN